MCPEFEITRFLAHIIVHKLGILQAPIMNFFINHQATEVIMDMGSECNIISDIRAHRLGLT